MIGLGDLRVKRPSIIRLMDIRCRFLILLIIMPAAIFTASLRLLPILLLLSAALFVLSKIEIFLFWKELRWYALSFTVFILVFALIFSSGSILVRALQGMAMAARFGLLMSLGTLFSLTSDPIEVPIAMTRTGLPHRFGVVLMIAYRMVPLISDRVTSVKQAQQARGARFLGRFPDLRRLWVELMSLAIPVVLSSFEVSVALSDTLIARGYDPNSPAITVPPHRGTWHAPFMLGVSLGVLALVTWERMH